MPDLQDEVRSPPASTATPPQDSLRRWRWLQIAVALVLAIGIAAVWMDLRNHDRALRLEVAQHLGQLDVTDKVTQETLKLTQDNLRDAQAKIALLENRLAESQSQQAALEALYRELAPSRDEWALTEVEQVLLLASQQLQLAGNVSSALAALQVADQKLQRLDRPQFVPLRRAIGRDIDRLKAVPFVDVPGLSLRLDQAIAAVETLPLALEERLPVPAQEAPPRDEPAWRRFLREAWADLRGLAARFDLLFRDQPNFRADLGAADLWLKKYFDTRAKNVQSLQTLVKELRGTDMTIELPALAGSLDAVRVLQLQREKRAR